jgi:hypothetical protein
LKKIYTSPNRMLVGLLSGALSDHGIGCIIRNDYLGGGVGDLPAQECWPELWVLRDQDEARARQVVDAVLPRQAISGEPWQCPQCGEWLEPQFAACWHCAPAVDP